MMTVIGLSMGSVIGFGGLAMLAALLCMIMCRHIGGVIDPNFVAVKLASNRRVVCGTPAYFEKHGIPRTLADLEDGGGITRLHIAEALSYGRIALAR